MFDLYVKWIEAFNDDIACSDEVSICRLFWATIKSLLITLAVIWIGGLVVFMYAFPIIPYVTDLPNDIGLLIISIFGFWVPSIWFFVRYRYPRLKKANTKPIKESRFIKLLSELYYAIKTKTCFKVKIRD